MRINFGITIEVHIILRHQINRLYCNKL